MLMSQYSPSDSVCRVENGQESYGYKVFKGLQKKYVYSQPRDSGRRQTNYRFGG